MGFRRHGEVKSGEVDCTACNGGWTQTREETISEHGRTVFTYGIQKCKACDGTGKR